ncbi:hypothetical protein BN1058_01869 [Paraliobacillus sp. PM-2]|uniref:hypothetical protein n=1 Tax=Paraliobacillus sp. PM-2 TaxID=1462524 RepID=UPI00061CACC0|nr:hypothetical protein [Paraliobacillus sp. PM-2]CQR47545.1 hypothetical protein BN1058_01869 [Paraliobacillus sp. PM-2]
MRRNNKPFAIIFILLFILFVIIPLTISIVYGNIPFYNNYNLENYDVLVSNDTNLTESDLSFIGNNAYTWSEIKSYIIRKERTYVKILRNTVFVVGIAIFSIIIDRIFFRK